MKTAAAMTRASLLCARNPAECLANSFPPNPLQQAHTHTHTHTHTHKQVLLFPLQPWFPQHLPLWGPPPPCSPTGSSPFCRGRSAFFSSQFQLHLAMEPLGKASRHWVQTDQSLNSSPPSCATRRTRIYMSLSFGFPVVEIDFLLPEKLVL